MFCRYINLLQGMPLSLLVDRIKQKYEQLSALFVLRPMAQHSEKHTLNLAIVFWPHVFRVAVN